MRLLPSWAPGADSSGRIESLDLFRGLTILAMVWVNDLARVRGIPAWLKHVPESADAMTFPDIVFPFFLFIVGMSIPIALGRRIGRGHGPARLAGHILGRVMGLLIIGVLMVNVPSIDAAATGLTRSQWSVLMYLGVILAWNDYPKAAAQGAVGTRRVPWHVLRYAGIVLLVVLALIYRGRAGDQTVWLRTQWWGILGLIGWAYLAATLGFLLVRGHAAGVAGLLGFALVLCVAGRNGSLDRFASLHAVNQYVSLGGHIGGHGLIVLAGVLAMLLVREPAAEVASDRRSRQGACRLLFMAGVLFVAGAVLRHPYEISKIRITPTWCLYSSAFACLVYAVLHAVFERLPEPGRSKAAGLRGRVGAIARGYVSAVGGNALLAFILPGIVYGLLNILRVGWLDRYAGQGAVGIGRSIGFTVAITAAIAVLGRLHVRLKL